MGGRKWLVGLAATVALALPAEAEANVLPLGRGQITHKTLTVCKVNRYSGQIGFIDDHEVVAHTKGLWAMSPNRFRRGTTYRIRIQWMKYLQEWWVLSERAIGEGTCK